MEVSPQDLRKELEAAQVDKSIQEKWKNEVVDNSDAFVNRISSSSCFASDI